MLAPFTADQLASSIEFFNSIAEKRPFAAADNMSATGKKRRSCDGFTDVRFRTEKRAAGVSACVKVSARRVEQVK